MRLAKMQAYFTILFALLLSSAALGDFQNSKSKTPQTVEVSLLGQPCKIRGPFKKKTLQKIHDIGPAQLYPYVTPGSPKSSKRSIEDSIRKGRPDSWLPTQLEFYREKAVKRLEAQDAFFAALLKFENSKEMEPFAKVIRDQLVQAEKDDVVIKTLLSKMKETPSNSPAYKKSLEQLYEHFLERIEADPEPEFHRAIKKLDVQYDCAFDDPEA